MRLGPYLKATGEKPYLFARRARTGQTGIYEYLEGRRIPTLPTLLAWVEASKARPAPDGAHVTLQDLVPDTCKEGGAA